MFKWQTNIEENQGSDSWSTVEASSAEEAAAMAGERYDNGDYTLLQGGEVVVRVRELGQEAIVQFTVYGESQPYYWAEKHE